MKQRTSYLGGWKLYPFSMIGHHVQGFVVAFAVLSGVMNVTIAAILWTALYAAYQGLSVLRKKDSAGLDIADFIVGFGIGIVAYMIMFFGR